MVVVHQTSATLVLVTLMLILRSAGMAALIQGAKAHLSQEYSLNLGLCVRPCW
jgi:hypothetical protein